VTLFHEFGHVLHHLLTEVDLPSIGALITGATKARQRVATFAIDGEVRFASAADRSAFAEELAATVADLVSRYHDQSTEDGRSHRLIVAMHPSVTTGSVTTGEEREH
jgi:hypothetical protein